MTDALLLKNTKFTKGLVMPKKGTYLELDQDEMEYVDGGVNVAIGIALDVIAGVCDFVLTFFAKKINIIAKGILIVVRSICGVAGLVISLGATSLTSVAKQTIFRVVSVYLGVKTAQEITNEL